MQTDREESYRTRTQQQQRGKVFKMSTFNSKTLSNFQNAKMVELIKQLDHSLNRITSYEQAVSNIQDKVKVHLQTHRCEDAELESEISQAANLSPKP